MRGLALGTTLVGVASLGFVGILYNTLPEEIQRPITQWALPLARVGVVPHHNAEIFGFKGAAFWFVVATAMFLAPLVALFAGREASANEQRPARRVGWGMLLAIPIALASGYPSFHVPARTPPYPLDYWCTYWQPPRRDRIAVLQTHTRSNTCAWHWIADRQDIIRMPAYSAYSRSQAQKPASQCQRWFFRRWFP
jgi:hypothetical protein